MRSSKCVWVLAIAILAIVIPAPGALAGPFTLGYTNPIGWAGSGARINNFPDSGPPSQVAWDISSDANATTSTSYGYMDASGWAESSAYVLKGAISSDDSKAWQAGGYFRDELYFATYNNQPAEFALTFSVSASAFVRETGYWDDDDNWVPDPVQNGFAWLNLGLNVPMTPTSDPQVNWYYLSNKFLVDVRRSDFSDDPRDYSMSVTLKSTDFNSDYLIGSGTYLPFTVSLWGTVNNATLHWGDTVELTGVQAFQDGHALDPSQFTILSENGESYFDDYAHGTKPTGSVPDPGSTLLLLGMSLAGLVGAARRRLR